LQLRGWCFEDLTSGPLRKNQGVFPHDVGELCSTLQDLADSLRRHQPFGDGSGPEQLLALTRRHKTHDGDFVIPQTGATRLMIVKRSPGVALHAFH
jgi:hypothetical protein